MTSKLEFENEEEHYKYLLKRRELTLRNHKQDSLFRVQQVKQLEYSVEQMEKNLEIIQQQLENQTVKAPIRGQLTSLNAEIGQSISRGQNLGQIDNIDAYKIRAAIDEHYIARVAEGQRGTFTFDNNSYTLVIKTVYPEVSAGRFEVDLLFDGEAPNGIRRGQTVHIKLELSAPEEVLFVEMGGFYQTTGGQWIFVLDEAVKSAVSAITGTLLIASLWCSLIIRVISKPFITGILRSIKTISTTLVSRILSPYEAFSVI